MYLFLVKMSRIKILIIFLEIIFVSIIYCTPIHAQSSVSNSWTITAKGFFANYMQDVDAFSIDISANWQSNVWTVGKEYTVAFTITAKTLHGYVDWVKVTSVEVQLRPDPKWYSWTEEWRTEFGLDVTNSTHIFMVECTPVGRAQQEDLYLIWIVNIEWQFTMPDGKSYDRTLILDNKGNGIYDPIPISLKKQPSLINLFLESTILLIVAVMVFVGAISYFIIKKHKKRTSNIELKTHFLSSSFTALA